MDEPQAVPSVPVPPPATTQVSVDGGLADNVAGALAYITIIPAILFLLIEPYSKRTFVRFNAFQCICLAVCWIVGAFVCGVIPLLGWFVLLPLFMLTMLVTVIICIVKAYSGVKFKVPVVGKFAEDFASK